MTMKKGMIVTSALIIWKALMCIIGSESPVVVVLSGSMEPGFKRGDILFLHMSKDPIRAGEIVVFNVDGREIPIVHHVIKVHEWQHTGEVDVLTKGARFWKIELFDWNLLRCNPRLLFLEVDIIIHGRWIQAVFCHSDDASSSSSMEASVKIDLPGEEYIEPKVRENTLTEVVNKFDVDMSEGVAVDMFGISPSNDNETVVVNLGESKYKIEVLSTEYQHTCKSTGLMLWESACLMASVLAGNPTIVAGKWVLELGCGCGGICSMAAVVSAVHSFLLVREYADYQSRIVVKSEVIFEV